MYGITNSRLSVGSAPSDVIKVKSYYKLLAGSLVDVSITSTEHLISPVDSGTAPANNTFRGQLMENANGDGTTELDCRILNSSWFSAVEASYSANAVTMFDASNIVPYTYQGVYGEGTGSNYYIPYGAVAFNQYTNNTEWCFCGTNFDYTNLNEVHTLLNFEDSVGNGDYTDKLNIQASKNNGLFSLVFHYRSRNGNNQTSNLVTTTEVANYITKADNLGTCKCRLFVSLLNNNATTGGSALVKVLYIDDITDKNSKSFYKQYSLGDYGSSTYMVATPMFVAENHYLIASGCGIHSIGNAGYYCLAGSGAGNYGATHIRTEL